MSNYVYLAWTGHYLQHVCRSSRHKRLIAKVLVASTMAFWFGVTSMIRPTGLERIPSSFILASMKQGLSAATTKSREPSIQHTAPPSAACQLQLSELVESPRPSVGGIRATSITKPRDQHLYLKCSSDSGGDIVSRFIERERSPSTYVSLGRRTSGRQCRRITLITNGKEADLARTKSYTNTAFRLGFLDYQIYRLLEEMSSR